MSLLDTCLGIFIAVIVLSILQLFQTSLTGKIGRVHSQTQQTAPPTRKSNVHPGETHSLIFKVVSFPAVVFARKLAYHREVRATTPTFGHETISKEDNAFQPSTTIKSDAEDTKDTSTKSQTTSIPSVISARQKHEQMQVNRNNTEEMCFRITGIPLSWDASKIEKLLQLKFEFERVDMFELKGPFPDCYGQDRVALLITSFPTQYLRSLPPREHPLELPMEKYSNGRRVLLWIDRDFYDFTPLNSPDSPIKADIIAITGLGGHAYGSWRSRAKTNHRPMWLSDFLPREVPHIRVMTYGYSSGLRNNHGTNLSDYRRGFLQRLQNSRRKCPTRPIIFIGHGLGGLLAIQTLVESILDPELEEIRQSICGMFLFGTPHQGLKIEELSQMVDNDTEGQYLLAQLKEGSEFLEQQRETLARVWKKFDGKVVSFYETKKTAQIQITEERDLERRGEKIQMIGRVSAKLHLPHECAYPIPSDHTDMVKFDSTRNQSFQTILTSLERWLPENDSVSLKSDHVIEQLIQPSKDAAVKNVREPSISVAESVIFQYPNSIDQIVSCPNGGVVARTSGGKRVYEQIPPLGTRLLTR